jgi:hypothetical protein
MSEVIEAIYVICQDNYSDGIGEPLVAYLDEATAKAAQTLMSKNGGCSVVSIRVPVWPHIPES